MSTKNKIGVLKGFVVGNVIKVWCPHCRLFHGHGWTGDKVRRGNWPGSHRGAHCIDESSPFKSTGYYIKPYTRTELARFGLMAMKP